MFAILALLGVESTGSTDETSIECADVDQVCERVRELIAARPSFQAITVLHIEDLPAALAGATDRTAGMP